MAALVHSLADFGLRIPGVGFMFTLLLAIFVLRRKHPEWVRPYRTLGYPIVPLIYVLFYAWFMGNAYMERKYEAGIGVGLVALGVPVYLGWRYWAKRHPPNLRDGE